ncbi:uncharacterized protein LOC119299853 [Triticum dicoccoides]|uniref:uncharacterized protein LOC119299853 n=1 Tax=Triticum dicoccoides TaxID=85692 RepID=UPI00188E5E44|nr:uncharacterized protein LOC119299853 [Triticum dicoccoides]
MPLSRRSGLMCEYTCDLKDPQRHCQIQLTDDDINDMTKSLLNESLADCSRTGLNPFCALNKPPAADLPFWSKKLQDKSAKKTRMNNKALEKPAKKKTNPFELFDLDDKDESEDDVKGSQANVEEQHEARRMTSNIGGGILSSGLPNTPAPCNLSQCGSFSTTS